VELAILILGGLCLVAGLRELTARRRDLGAVSKVATGLSCVTTGLALSGWRWLWSLAALFTLVAILSEIADRRLRRPTGNRIASD